MPREKMDFDVIIIGAGPAGLSTAIRLAQCAQKDKKTLRICLVEKGASVGAHLLSGAILDPRALDELIPNWKAEGAPCHTGVAQEKFLWLT